MAEEKGSKVAGVELGGTKCVVTLAEGRDVLDQARVATTTPGETLPAIRTILQGWQFAALGVELRPGRSRPRLAYLRLHHLDRPSPAGATWTSSAR